MDSLTFNHVVNCAVEGNQVCLSAIQAVGKHLGDGIADLVNIFNPEMIVIGGAFAYGQQILMPIIEEIIAETSLPPINKSVDIKFSDHGADGCVLGAIAIVLDDIIREVAFNLTCKTVKRLHERRSKINIYSETWFKESEN